HDPDAALHPPGRGDPVLMLHLLLTAALWATTPQVAGPVDDQQRQVLVVYSTRRDAQLALIGERELPRVLEDGLARRLDYYAEFVDPVRFPDPAYQAALGTFLRLKYRDHQFEVIIAIGDEAEAFV